MAFQKLTHKNSFSERHHLRVWRTGIVLPEGKKVWVAAASFDTRLKVQLLPPFLHHETSPDLDRERGYVVASLEDAGAARIKKIRMNPRTTPEKPYKNAYGAKYYTDGQAVVVEV